MLADAGDSLITLEPMTLCVFGVAVLAWTAMLGVSLKLAFKVTGAEAPGYFSCLGYALLLPIVNGLITTVAYATVGPLYGLVGILQLYIQIKILMVAGNCGGWRAFFSGIVHGLFSGFAAVGIFLAVLFSGAIDQEEVMGSIQTVANEAQAEIESRGSHAIQSASNGSLPWSAEITADGATINPYFEQQ